MPNKDFQKELKEKVKEGVKPSDLKKLKKSKSADDISSSLTPNIPLKKSQSQLEIPLTQPSSKQQITQLKEQVQFHAETAKNYLQFLQTSQAKVSELEEKLKNNPPRPLLADQLKEKQREIEALREKLETAHSQLSQFKNPSSWPLVPISAKMQSQRSPVNFDKFSELDQSLIARHKALKDWFTEYAKVKKLEQELGENIDEASNELIRQDDLISDLRSKNQELRVKNESLTRDLELVQRAVEWRKNPYIPYSEPDWTYLRLTLYSLLVIGWFYFWMKK